MNTTLLLRIAALIALLFALGHSAGAPWTPTEEPSAASVVAAMKSVSFDVVGAHRSYWDFYFGFGVGLSIYMFAQAAFLWLLAALAKTQAAAVRSFVIVLLAANIANGVVLWRHFFIVPIVFAGVLIGCLALALWASARHS